MKNPFIRSSIAAGLIIVHLLLVACDKKSTNPKEEKPPSMPPAESMRIDLSVFSGGGNQSAGKISSPQSQLHFGTAVVTLGLVNLSVVLHLAVPAAIFVQALTEQPELQNDGKFHWVYTSVYQLAQYQADLAGWVDMGDARVKWEMAVTRSQQNLDHFKWYEGSCNIEATSGDWIFYDYLQPQSSVPVVQIDWQISGDTDRLLVFENVFAGDVNEGDRLTYSIEGDSARVQYDDASASTTAKIVWNTTTTAGYIQAPNYNGGVPARWDENHDDM
ncbi:hypothetical protein JW824_04625 [bacterium]|nr:hypothetical protein [bacterium]